jgi:uncharacterized ion transporter superfamily protein YfcC
MASFRLPHPFLLLVGGVAVATALTWVLPAGQFDRRDDPATGRSVVVAGTYHPVDRAPVGLFQGAVAIPRGIVAAIEVIVTVLLVGGAFVVVERVGTLGRVVGALVGRFRGAGGRELWVIPIVSFLFAAMGALENMQEEIVALVPVLLVLGAGIGVDAVVVVAMSAGAAAVGSAMGPTNPFQAGIAMKLAELPALSGGGLRVVLFVVALALWVGWTLRHARRTRTTPVSPAGAVAAVSGRDWLVLALTATPLAFYVYGVLRLDWGFNELSAGFFVAAFAVGLLGRLGLGGTTTVFLEGMQTMLPAGLLIGVARSISVVLTDGRVIDTILHALATPLGQVPPAVSAGLMIPFHALVHVPVPSVSGQAVLTMPVMVPLADLLGLSRQVAVLAYQTGAGLCELLTPTNGALMAVLLAAKVPYGRWVRFAIGGVLLVALVGVAGMAAVMLGIV